MRNMITLIFVICLGCITAQSSVFAGHLPTWFNLHITVEQIAQHLVTNNVVIVDTRESAIYDLGHIPNAINLPSSATFNQVSTSRIASSSHIAKLLGDHGIGQNTNVILYDDGSSIHASWVFWVLEVYGHKSVAILDGGYAAWLHAGFVSSTIKPKITTKVFHAVIDPSRLASRLHVMLGIKDASKAIVDARNTDEYDGIKTKAFRSGHIPTAITIPRVSLFEQSDGINLLKPLEQLRETFSPIDKHKKVITYCNKGKEATLNYYVLRRLGYKVAVYDGSWFEWGNSSNLPIEN